MRPSVPHQLIKDSALLLALALAACGGGGDALSPTQSVPLVSQGVVVDDQGLPLADARITVVSASGLSGTDTRTTTDSEGRFRLALDPATPVVIRVDKGGYASGLRAAQVASQNTTVAQRVTLWPVASTQTFDPTQEAVLRVPGSTARVTLPPNALVRDDGQPLSGPVTVALTPVDPAANIRQMPGLMVDAGSGEPIESLGALGVSFTDASGAPLNLASGQQATVRIAATPAAGATLPASYPLYHLNETTGRWVQEGLAQLGTDAATGQRYYEGRVSHFSWWNADQVYSRTTLTLGATTAGATCTLPTGTHVVAQGVDYNGLSQAASGQVFVRADSRVQLTLLDSAGQVLDTLEARSGAAGGATGLSRCLTAPPDVTVGGRVTVSSGQLSNYRVQLTGAAIVPVTLRIGADGRYSTALPGQRGTVNARLVATTSRGTPDTTVSGQVADTALTLPDLNVADTQGDLSGCVQGWAGYRRSQVTVSVFRGSTLLSSQVITAGSAGFFFRNVPLNSTLSLRLTPPDASLAEREQTVAVGNSSVALGTCLSLPQGPQARIQLSGSGLSRSFDASTSTADPESAIAAYAWDFGDGSTGQGPTASHTYASAGSYTARLTVTDALGQQSSTTVPALITQGNLVGLAAGRQVASGELHTCYINSQGGVACEGYDGYGQLGSGELYASVQPTAVLGLTSGVREVAAGGNFSCALTEGGAVYCWGENGFGQLGSGTAGGYSATPVRVTGLGDGVQAIAAGHSHACAITQAGGLKCWGDNGLGQLGTPTDGPANASALAVQGLTEGVVVLGLGSSQSCAGTADGRVYCWGAGQGSPTVVSGLNEGVVAISPGHAHVCAVTRSNALTCWGDDSFGQRGNGSNTDSLEVVGGDSGYVSVSSGPQHSCALQTDGLVRCWGRNDRGQLGDGGNTNSEVPVVATQQSGTATGVSARGYASCVLRTNRSLQCWGWLENSAPGG